MKVSTLWKFDTHWFYHVNISNMWGFHRVKSYQPHNKNCHHVESFHPFKSYQNIEICHHVENYYALKSKHRAESFHSVKIKYYNLKSRHYLEDFHQIKDSSLIWHGFSSWLQAVMRYWPYNMDVSKRIITLTK